MSLAHRGYLFLDELGEFDRQAIEALREPLEAGEVTLSRLYGRCSFPAAFTLIAALNPCPCGFLHDPQRPCRCRPAEIAISGSSRGPSWIGSTFAFESNGPGRGRSIRLEVANPRGSKRAAIAKARLGRESGSDPNAKRRDTLRCCVRLMPTSKERERRFSRRRRPHGI